jgi:FlaA1/EpsC-like NDP-sugar epimerase
VSGASGQRADTLLVALAGGLPTLRRQIAAMGDQAPPVAGELDLASVEHDARLAGAACEAAAGGATRAILSGPVAMGDRLAAVAGTLRGAGLEVTYWPTPADVLRGAIRPNAGVARTPDARGLAGLIGREPRPIDRRLADAVLRGKRVLITGAGGSIGSELARIAARFGPERLILMDRSDNALFEIDRHLGRAHPSLDRSAALHDVVDEAGTLARLRDLRPHTIFHAAAHKHVPLMEDHPVAAINNNLFGTKSVADAADAVGAERFVMISTDKAVNPTSIMGATKRLAELYVRSLNATSATRYSLVRFGNVLGSNCSVLPIWAGQVAEGGPITVTHASMERFFMTIPEAAGLVIQSAGLDDAPAAAGQDHLEVCVLDMGEPVRILDLARRYARSLGLEPVSRGEAGAGSGPAIEIAVTGVRPGEKLYEELAYDAEELAATSAPGVLAWAGPRPDPGAVARMIEDMSGARVAQDPREAIRAIHRHIPELTRPRPEQDEAPGGAPGAGTAAHAA